MMTLSFESFLKGFFEDLVQAGILKRQPMLEAPRMDPPSRPDGEPQDEMSIFTSHGREEVLTTIKSAQNMHSKE
jgi:hypothetical protein